MSQNPLSVIVKVKPDRIEDLTKLLDKIGLDIKSNDDLVFSNVRTLHFASMVLLDRDDAYAPALVFESNHDGTTEEHIADLADSVGPGLHKVFSHCDEYPSGSYNPAALKSFLAAKNVKTPAFYVGCFGHDLNSINNALNTRQAIEDFLDDLRSKHAVKSKSKSKRELYQLIKQHLKDNPVQPPAGNAPTHASIMRKSKVATWGWILLAAALLLKWPRPILIALALFLVFLRYREITDARSKGPTPPPIDPRLFGKEDIFTQNHLTTLVNVKPGKFRLGTLKAVLALVNVLAKTVFIAGSLGGIPTIHFARWLMMDNDERLLFFSNYDGSWASYLGDFVDKANYGLTAIWGNTENFPPSSFLFLGGARHIEAFKLWSRQHNEYAAVWYSAYPDATVSNITQSIQVRDGLQRELNNDELNDWFKLI